MRWLSFEDLDARAAEFDAAIAASPEVDGFCSSSDWILPARAAFAPAGVPLILDAGAAGFAALMTLRLEGGAQAVFPLEPCWGLASPFAGRDPELLVAALFQALREDPHLLAQTRVLSLSGITGAALKAVVRQATGDTIRPGVPAPRIVASLEGGVDGFLSRRSAKFRASTRRARRAAEANGIRYERLSPRPEQVDGVFARILEIERRCWKAAEASGIDAGPMLEFYTHMLPRLARRGALRVVFVSREGTDLAYCFGGLFGDTYRGLQVSFDARFERDSPGVLAHMEMISLLVQEGVRAYDLGSDMEYKRRWGELGLETITCLIVRHPARNVA
jgi:CelD/BcsL family acetyltransferase involved in cellulose biosynthesis